MRSGTNTRSEVDQQHEHLIGDVEVNPQHQHHRNTTTPPHAVVALPRYTVHAYCTTMVYSILRGVRASRHEE